MNEREAYEHALANVERRIDGDFDHKKLVDLMVGELDSPDVEEMNLNRARAYIKRQTEPAKSTAGLTDQLVLDLDDGKSVFPYEPRRLLKDSDDHLIELSKAKPQHLGAHVARSGKNLERIVRRHRHDSELSSRYSEWAIEQLRAGAKWSDTTFDHFVRAEGIISPIAGGDH